MAVHVRLRRIGRNPKKQPHFRVTVFEETRSRDGRIIEELGFYSPLTGASRLNKERISSWVKKGAVLSQTVKSLMKK